MMKFTTSPQFSHLDWQRWWYPAIPADDGELSSGLQEWYSPVRLPRLIRDHQKLGVCRSCRHHARDRESGFCRAVNWTLTNVSLLVHLVRMRVLCVAEKPSISKSITKILSGGQYTTHNTQSQYVKNYEFDYPQTNSLFIVTCVAGHLLEHDFTDAHRKWNSCSPGDLFDAPIESKVGQKMKAIEQNLMIQARRVSTLMIWTDCDREGEHIGTEIVSVCRRVNRNIVVKRARFSAIIAQQIHRAAQHPVELDLAQADAVEARILLDLRIGAAFTRMQTLSLQTQVQQLAEKLISYGPCQFPTLGFVVQRYNQVKNFVPEDFWYIFLSYTSNTPLGRKETAFNWSRGHLFDEVVVIVLYEHVLEFPDVRVAKVLKKDTKKWKPLPLTTVELQKAGSRLLKMAPKKILDIAEKLYQQGFVSYPRTETDQFDSQFDFMSLIQKQTLDPNWGNFAQSLEQGEFGSPREGKNNDKAHPPIHPTAYAGNLTGDEKRVYEYIARRFLACCSKDAEGWQTTVEVVCGGEFFHATGLVILKKNYLDVYPYDKWSDHPLPEFKEGESFRPTCCEMRSGKTSKPHLLTEADLVTLMDKNGIGTDATIAQHIQNIVDREYVIERMEGSTKYLVPSTLGIALVEGYDQIGLDRSVSKPQLRRETERRMVLVGQRNITKEAMLDQALEQYKEMFRVVRDNWGVVTRSVRQYLQGGGNGTADVQVRNGRDDDDDRGGNNGNGGGRGGGGGDGGGGGGRGGNRGSGAAAPTSKRSRGGRSGRNATSEIIDVDMDGGPEFPTTSNAFSISRSSAASTSSSTTRHTHKATTAIASPGVPDSNVPCGCGLPAVKKKNNVSGINSSGKDYYMCSRDACGFWKWADDVGSNSGSGSGPVVPAKRTFPQANNDPTQPDRMCKCGVPGLLLTALKEGPNQGRRFWKCSNAQNNGDCQFFEWADEPPRQTGGISGKLGGGSTGSGSCFKCGQEGHWSNNCPNQGNDILNKRPRSLGTGFASNETTGGDNACFKCGKEGHFASACPNLLSTGRTNPTGGTNANGTCFTCGKEGHWSNACPNNSGLKYNGRTTGTATGGKSGRGGTAKRGRERATSATSTTTTTKKKRGRPPKKSSFAAADGC